MYCRFIGKDHIGSTSCSVSGVSTPDLPVFPSLLVPPPVVALMPQCRLQLSPCSWQISLPPPGRRPRPLAMVRANLAESWPRFITLQCVLHSSPVLVLFFSLFLLSLVASGGGCACACACVVLVAASKKRVT